VLYICLFQPNYLHVFPHHIHKPPPWPSSFPPSGGSIHTDVPNVPPLHMSNPSQSHPPHLVSKTSYMCCPSNKLISNPVHRRHSQQKPQHLQLGYLQLHLLSFIQCHCLYTVHHRSHHSPINFLCRYSSITNHFCYHSSSPTPPCLHYFLHFSNALSITLHC
ncbi:hypothetical protein HF521_021393, partial [Silurus meridionalis]